MTDTDVFAPPTAPFLSMPVTSQAERVRDTLKEEGRPEPEDIPEPKMPQDASRSAQEPPSSQEPPGGGGGGQMPHEVLLPLVGGFLGHIQKKLDEHVLEKFRASDRALNDMCTAVQVQVESTLRQKAFVDTVQLQAPCSVCVEAVAPGGFPVRFTLTAPGQDVLGGELMDLIHNLEENGFTPPS